MVDEEEPFVFTFKDNRKILLSQNQVINISTTFFYKYINKDNGNIITIPDNITYENFKEFIDIFQKNTPILEDQASQQNKLKINDNIDLVQLIEISEYFGNDSFSIFLINELFLSGDDKINKNNSYLLLILSYNKLNELNNNNYNEEEEIEAIWLDLFIKSLDVVGKNLIYFFEDKKLDSFDKKIIDELFEKFSMYLISNDFIIDSQENNDNKKLNIENENIISLKILKNIIDFLINRRAQNDFFCLLSNEFMKISSEENINEINNLPNPTFLLKLDVNELSNYYEEFPIENQINNNDQKTIVFTINYKKIEDSFNVSLKLTKYDKQNGKNNNSNIMTTNNNLICSFDILTFLSSVSIEELDIKQINIKSISNNKSRHEIFKINNFNKILSTINKEYLTLKIFLKPCYTHSMLCNYLYYNFDELYNNKNIFKINKSLLNIIVRKKQVNNNNEINMDKIVICLFNWLNDEINIKEDISEIVENIKWNNISLTILFEFIIKYAKNISQKELEHIFLNSLIGRSKNYTNIELFSQEIIKSLLISSKNMDYISLFCENRRLNKFNSYEMINQERNMSQNDNSHEKYSIIKKNSKDTDKSNLIKNLDNIKDNDSIVINNYIKKQNKSTTNLNNNLKITNSKKNISLSKNKNNIINSPKVTYKERGKKESNNYYSNKRNKSIDFKYMTCQNKKGFNKKKKFQRIDIETNNKKNLFNKSLYNNKIFKIINYNDSSNAQYKRSKNTISLITELNKLKLKVKSNCIESKNKKYKNKINMKGFLNKTENNY